jgi:hypothetical protein
MRKHALGFLLLLASTLVVLGCGNDLDGETLIGAPCAEDSDCDPGAGVCITTVEPGLCSQPCDRPGAAQSCPLGAYCDEQQVETATDTEAKMTLCFPACDRDSDCREGYACNGVSEGPGKVCSPKK